MAEMNQNEPSPLQTTMQIPLLTQLVMLTTLLGKHIRQTITGFGALVRFSGQVFAGIPHVRTWTRGDRLTRQLFFVGTMSLPVIGLTGAFIGMILAFEGYLQFASIGQQSRLGGVINISIVKQLGPVLAAVMLAGRVGCSLAAELGTMRVTEQLDAMRAMASDPVRVLVVPRVVACVAMIPVLTVVSNLCGVIGAWLICTKFYSADPDAYWRFSRQFVTGYSIFNGLIKSVSYGAAIGIISCYKGFNCQPGAEGVGKATTNAFVSSFLAIIFLSLILAKLLNDIDFIIHGGTQSVFG
jgi:phospholipid/cholesterol/gamma-HCH transport system permease protein